MIHQRQEKLNLCFAYEFIILFYDNKTSLFKMYDIDRDGRLSKEDIQETLKMMVSQ